MAKRGMESGAVIELLRILRMEERGRYVEPSPLTGTPWVTGSLCEVLCQWEEALPFLEKRWG